MKLKVGDRAPDFTLPTHNEGELNLGWYRGRKHVVLAFYPGDWTSVCATQIPQYEKLIDRFHENNVQLLAVSVDSIPCHVAWAKSLGGFSFPLMSDYFPHGDVSQRYGVLNERGYANRAVFLIDVTGTIRYIEQVPLAELPSNDELFAQIAALNHKSI